MKKGMALILAGVLFSGITGVQAAPASGYSEFIQAVDSILAGAVMPVAGKQDIAVRMPFQPDGQALQILEVAKAMLGQPVVWGGASPAEGFDCSGLVQYVYRQAGIYLPRTADWQFEVGRPVSLPALQPGDLVYFTTYAPGASHVGIYLGANKFIHTSSSQQVVAIGDLDDPYFVARFYGAKRVI